MDDQNIEDAVRHEYLQRCLSAFRACRDPIKAIDTAVPSAQDMSKTADLMLKGKPAVTTDALWSTLQPYVKLRNSLLGALTYDDLPSEDEFRDGKGLDFDLPKPLPIANRYGVIWSTYSDNQDRTASAEELCCQFGLGHMSRFFSGAVLSKVEYSNSALLDTNGAKVPTVVEAASHAPFYPAPKGEATGWTRDLRNDNPTHPEWVHGPIDLSKVVRPIMPASKLNPTIPNHLPDGYLTTRLS